MLASLHRSRAIFACAIVPCDGGAGVLLLVDSAGAWAVGLESDAQPALCPVATYGGELPIDVSWLIEHVACAAVTLASAVRAQRSWKSERICRFPCRLARSHTSPLSGLTRSHHPLSFSASTRAPHASRRCKVRMLGPLPCRSGPWPPLWPQRLLTKWRDNASPPRTWPGKGSCRHPAPRRAGLTACL